MRGVTQIGGKWGRGSGRAAEVAEWVLSEGLVARESSSRVRGERDCERGVARGGESKSRQWVGGEYSERKGRDSVLSNFESNRAVPLSVTYLKCGGVVLGIAANHISRDDCSAFYFIQTWAAVARGEGTRTPTPLPTTTKNIRNAVVRTSAVSEVSTITSKPVHVLAEIVQSAVDGITDEFVRSFIDYMELMQGKTLHSTLELAESNLRISSISGLPIYEANFGWGAPQKASGAVAPGNNNVYVLDEPGRNAGVQMYITLDATIMPLFEKVFYELTMVDTKNNSVFTQESAGTCGSS
ncbi:hypothetical protein LUZ61_013760 [Rhynchospora tenuis]|uniref:Uncharacterized protein n=1 Tax=Rhynchospora tenuis TaxID=198213 RepID=A0AAD5W9D0_9POAL|nr:hypothetical protein LUZ61_013760 [Rhynchospora tenuis]